MKISLKVISVLSVAVLSVVCMDSARAENPYQEGYLSGDWGGRRSSFYNSGIDTEVVLTMDYFNVTSGGTKTGANIVHNLDARAEFDGEKVFGIKNNTSNIHFIIVGGGDPNAKRIGSVEGIDNIESGVNSLKLYEAWTEQTFMDDKFALLLGLRDINADFLDMEMTGNFMKPTMQLMPTVAGSGKAGPSGFPNTALAARLKYEPDNLSYFQFGVFDGVPGNAKHPRGTHISLGGKDGALLIGEAGFTPRIAGQEDRTPNKLAIGAWRYTARQSDLLVATSKKINQGVYFLGSYEFYGDAQGRTLGGFFKTGFANDSTHQTDFDYQFGLVGNGLIPIRKQAEVGIGFTEAENSDTYMAANPGSNSSEYSFNAYYHDEVAPGIMVQPEFQYIVNPGTALGVKSATVLGARVQLNF